MTTRSENTVTINAPVEKVHAALTNADYWAHNVANLSTEPGQVHSFEGDASGAVATLFEVLPIDLLPAAVQAMISQSLKVKRVVNIGPLSDGTAYIEYTADVKGTPVDFKGSITLTGDDASSTLNYENQITVAIPMMGAAIEPKVADALGELFQNEANLCAEWISNNL
ncbi:MAG: DUF2505 domain-containing protein [Corynebacterium sp.]|nr:DUF2505 domain-containing protein [Corynebacterium sp.]